MGTFHAPYLHFNGLLYNGHPYAERCANQNIVQIDSLHKIRFKFGSAILDSKKKETRSST